MSSPADDNYASANRPLDPDNTPFFDEAWSYEIDFSWSGSGGDLNIQWLIRQGIVSVSNSLGVTDAGSNVVSVSLWNGTFTGDILVTPDDIHAIKVTFDGAGGLAWYLDGSLIDTGVISPSHTKPDTYTLSIRRDTGNIAVHHIDIIITG